MFNMSQPLINLRQVAYVVPDLDTALKYWVEVLKAGPFFKLDHAPLEHKRYRGAQNDVDISLALGYSGDLQIELIQQHNDVPSVFKEFLDTGRQGVHHIGLMPADYQATLDYYRSLGHEVAFECDFGGAELTYVDTLHSLGHFVELWDNHDNFKGLFTMIADAAKEWDGTDPIRSMPG